MGRGLAAGFTTMLRQALIVVWEASDRICSKRLRPLLPILVEAMAILADPGGPPGNGKGSICRSQPQGHRGPSNATLPRLMSSLFYRSPVRSLKKVTTAVVSRSVG